MKSGFPDRWQPEKALFGDSIAAFSIKRKRVTLLTSRAAYGTRPPRLPQRLRCLRFEGDVDLNRVTVLTPPLRPSPARNRPESYNVKLRKVCNFTPHPFAPTTQALHATRMNASAVYGMEA